jgi:hypothetical protein
VLSLSGQPSLWASEPLVLQHFIQFSFAEPHLLHHELPHVGRERRGESAGDPGREAELDEVLKN